MSDFPTLRKALDSQTDDLYRAYFRRGLWMVIGLTVLFTIHIVLTVVNAVQDGWGATGAVGDIVILLFAIASAWTLQDAAARRKTSALKYAAAVSIADTLSKEMWGEQDWVVAEDLGGVTLERVQTDEDGNENVTYRIKAKMEAE